MLKEFDINDLTLVQNALANLGDCSNKVQGNSSITQRLLSALMLSYAESSQLDILVLIRQFLTHVDYWQKPSKCELELPKELTENFTDWEKIGLVERRLNERSYVSARVWNPDWLEPISGGIDGDVSGEVICRNFSKNAVLGDPFLNNLGYKTYRSAGQRSAIRGALSTPPSENLIINLPTGEGKSLIFQLIHSVGFMTKNPSKNRGLTLVIVPTIALGTDLEKETSEICDLELPLFYESGNKALRDTFIDKIKSGENCILFASPEAITSQHSLLKLALLDAAKNGSIKALVVDEAHLIEAWGTDFRDDFQQLGALREKLISSAPVDCGLRTVFLSATIAPSAKSTLELIFNKGEEIKSINAGSLRAEPLFLKSKVISKETQIKQVTEAILRAPRPCILYVSTKDDAKFWFSELAAIGFNRIGIIHGGTNNASRKRVLERWKVGDLDFVVGTSAFGIGINYASVKTVIHACVPESLDRFYQEVGRGGRDGRKCLSILIPKREDVYIASRLASKTLIGQKRGLHRWKTMFESKTIIDRTRFFIKFDAPPGSNDNDINMVGDFNSRWNLRVLNLLMRSGAINIKGPPDYHAYKQLKSNGFLEVEILNDSHLSLEFWASEIEPVRAKMWNEYQENFDMMMRFIDETICPADVLAQLYGSKKIKVQCSSCIICQNNKQRKYNTGNRNEPRSPWVIQATPQLADLIGRTNKLLIDVVPEELSRRERRRLFEALYNLRIYGLNKYIQLGSTSMDLDACKKVISQDIIFWDEPRFLSMSRLPRGGEVIFLGEDYNLSEADLMENKDPRIFICNGDLSTPSGRVLKDVFSGRRLSLTGFIKGVFG